MEASKGILPLPDNEIEDYSIIDNQIIIKLKIIINHLTDLMLYHGEKVVGRDQVLILVKKDIKKDEDVTSRLYLLYNLAIDYAKQEQIRQSQ